MHILLGFLAAVGAIIFFIYRMTSTYQAGRSALDDGREMLGDARALYRRTKWNMKKSGNPVDALDDPREIATVLMMEVAKADGDMTAPEKAKILELMQRHFDIEPEDATDMMAVASFKTQQVPDVENILVKILRPVNERLTDAEKRDLISMMHEVGAVDGADDPYRDRFISVVHDKLLGPGARH